MKAIYWRLLPLIIFVFLVLFFWRGLSLEPQKLPSAQLNKPLPAFNLSTLGEEKIFSPELMRGQVALLNVWASWCSACVDENVFLLQLSRTGIPIYGLNYKDKTDAAKSWLTEWGNPYQSVGEDKNGKVAIDLGVYGAPETFLIDKKGIIRYRHVGILDDKSWKSVFAWRIKQLLEEA